MPPYDIAPRMMQAWKASGLTKAQLADKAGMRWAQVQKVLTGKRPQVSADTVRRLARALGCTTDYLLGMDEDDEEEHSLVHGMEKLSRLVGHAFDGVDAEAYVASVRA